MKNLLMLLTSLLGILFSGCGQPSYNLHQEVSPGEVFRSEGSFRLEGGRLVISASGQSVEGQAEMFNAETTEMDVLKAEEGKPTRLKLSVMESRFQIAMRVPGESPEETSESNVLAGRSILFERDGENWSSRLVGGEPTKEQQIEMKSLVDPWPEDLVPDRKVKVGESWSLTGEKLRTVFGFAPEGFTGKAQVHFEEVLEYNGEQCALLSIQVDASGKVPDSELQEMTASLSGEGHIYRSLAKKIDVYSKISGDITWKMTGEEDGQTFQMTIKGSFVTEYKMTKD